MGQRQAEIMRQSLEEAVAALQSFTAQPPSPEKQMAQQAETLKKQYEAALANLNELNEIGNKSSHEAAETITKRISECLDEVAKTLADMGQSKGK